MTQSHRERDRAVRIVHREVSSSVRQTRNHTEPDPNHAALQHQEADQDLAQYQHRTGRY